MPLSTEGKSHASTVNQNKGVSFRSERSSESRNLSSGAASASQSFRLSSRDALTFLIGDRPYFRECHFPPKARAMHRPSTKIKVCHSEASAVCDPARVAGNGASRGISLRVPRSPRIPFTRYSALNTAPRFPLKYCQLPMVLSRASASIAREVQRDPTRTDHPADSLALGQSSHLAL